MPPITVQNLEKFIKTYKKAKNNLANCSIKSENKKYFEAKCIIA